MITLGKPADYELANTIAKRDPSFKFDVPMATRNAFLDKAEALGCAREEFEKDNSLFGKMLKRKASEEQYFVKVLLSSRAAFSTLSSFGTVSCGEQYYDHRYWRDNLKEKYDVEKFEADYENWLEKHYSVGDTSTPEPDFSHKVYPAPDEA